MKIKDGFLVKNASGSKIIVPICNPNFDAIMTVNETGEFIFNLLNEHECTVDDVVAAILEIYAAPESLVRADVENFVAALKKANLLVD